MEKRDLKNGFYKNVQKILGTAMDVSYKLPNALPIEIRGLDKVPKDMPCLFVINHSNSHDYPNLIKFVSELSRIRERKTFNTLIGGDSLDFTNKVIFKVSGSVLIDRFDKEDSLKGIENMRSEIRHGNDTAIFGESTWNMHPYVPMLIVKMGFAKLGAGERTAIVPLIFEYVETKDKVSKEPELYEKLIISVCNPYMIGKDDNALERATEIGSIMSQARLDLWKETNTHTATLEGRELTNVEKEVYLHNKEIKKHGMGFNYDSEYELDMLLPLGNGYGRENEYFEDPESGLFVPLTKENAGRVLQMKPLSKDKKKKI